MPAPADSTGTTNFLYAFRRSGLVLFMKALAEFPLADMRQIRGVLFDIDDTLTTDGQLTAEAYAAMTALKSAGFITVPITGRPAGWCDHIARMWPVDGVIGENGAFYFHFDPAERKLKQRFIKDELTRQRDREQLTAVARHILHTVPGTALASDQRYREADIAVDFCEDVPALPRAEVERIKTLMESAGLTAKISSIHVNGWLGDYDKLSTTQLFMKEQFRIDLDARKNEFVFVGDSPNDAPMFAWFPLSVGVANVREFLDFLQTQPTYVTPSRCGEGFAQLVDALIGGKRDGLMRG
jgi:HAD superfamily hydrolase (TIGR01484 family)